jgi:predicted lipid-binding transport protein (Tim44 family)
MGSGISSHSNSKINKLAIGLIVIYLFIILALLIGMFVYVVQIKADSSKAVISSGLAASASQDAVTTSKDAVIASQEAADELKKLNLGFTKAGTEVKLLLDAVVKLLTPS